jgi:hypothetical protein
MVSNKCPQCHGIAFALLLIAGLSQSSAFRAHRSDSAASKQEVAEDFAPFTRPHRAAVGSVKRSDAVEPLLGTFNTGGKFKNYRQAMASVRMNAEDSATAEGASSEDAEPMKDLALAALDSGGDPAKIEPDIAKLKAEYAAVLEAQKVNVLAMAKEMPGVTGPLGFFDPLGFCTECSEGKLCFYREVELKHGRVGMLAALGFLVGEQFHPLFGGNINVPSYIAFQQTPLQTFWPAVVAAIAIPEVFSVFTFNPPIAEGEYKQEDPIDSPFWTVKTDRVGGDFGFDPLGLKPKDPKEFKEMQTKEINNGRLAMLAAAGMIAQELATGKKLF